MTRSALLSSIALSVVLAGCATDGSQVQAPLSAQPVLITAAPDVDMIPPAGQGVVSAPSLSSIEDEAPPLPDVANVGAGIRENAIEEAALSYGARAGLAYGSHKIDGLLEANRAALDGTWDLSRLEIPGPNGTRILPPVITQDTDVYDQPDDDTVVMADQQYEIVAQARFSPTVPLWQSYLIMPVIEPKKPDFSVYPQSPAERALWKASVDEGWAAGEDQALASFRARLALLQRDYVGMVTWATLVTEGKASAPVVAATLQGVTGGGDKMSVGQGVVRITSPSALIANPTAWQSGGSNQ